MTMASLAIIDVGHGNSAAIRENELTVIVDAGQRSHLLEYLHQHNIKTVELAILSHSDQDHIAGLESILLNNIHVKRVVLNSDSAKTSITWRDLITTLDEFQQKGMTRFQVGLTTGPVEVPGFHSITLEAVSPSSLLAAFGVGGHDAQGRRLTTNSISACIKVSFEGQSTALLTGDMDKIAFDDAMRIGANLSAPFLVFPHHGGKPGNSEPREFTKEIISAVKPKTVLFSHGRSKFDNPDPLIVGSVKEASPDCRIVCTQLSKNCSQELPNAPQTHLSGFSAGAQSRHCCAGTVLIDLKAGQPDQKFIQQHEQYISTSIQGALCKKTVVPSKTP